jgi:hypothetical protein
MGYVAHSRTIARTGCRDRYECNMWVDTIKDESVLINILIDNTDSKHLKLYSVMAEYDNAGFPLTYSLLSTATAIDQGSEPRPLSV